MVVVNASACMQQADPTNYSASITDVLSDLWPGPMVVFMMQGNGVTQIGPRTAPSVGEELKVQVNSTQFGGNVPLEQGIQAAQNFFQQNGSPQGSRVIVLTPTLGMTENAQALSQSVAAFAQEKVAVYTYGMAAAGSDQGTVSLLQQIANATGGDYQSISNASGMSQAVTHFCASNCGDSFTPIKLNTAHHDYTIRLQDASQSLNLLTFYDARTKSNALGYAGRQISASSSLPNNHYEFDTVSGLQEKCPCDITLDTGDATDVWVYAFKAGQPTRQLQLPSQQPHQSLSRLTWPLIGIIGLVVALLLIILIYFLRWSRQPPITGHLVNARNERNALALDTYRPWLARLFKKSIITMQELAQHPNGLLVVGTLTGEPLAFVATETGMVLRVLQGDAPHISVRTPEGTQKFSAQRREIALGRRSEILKDDRNEVIFQLAVPRGLTATRA